MKEEPLNSLHIDCSGIKRWYKEGKRHRDDGPAVIYPDGTQFWYTEGKIHRDDGPSVIWSGGKEYWYKDDEVYTPSAHELMVWKMKQKQKANHD